MREGVFILLYIMFFNYIVITVVKFLKLNELLYKLCMTSSCGQIGMCPGPYLRTSQHGPWPGAATFGWRQVFRTRLFIVPFHDLSIRAFDTSV